MIVIGAWNIGRRSFVKAASTIARYALMLAIALAEGVFSQLVSVLQRLTQCLCYCHVEKRNKAPSAFQLLESHDTNPLPLNTVQSQVVSTT